jgi:hypothetical protein
MKSPYKEEVIFWCAIFLSIFLFASSSNESISSPNPINTQQKVDILNCESGGRHYGVWGDHHKAYGIAQFHQGTFDRFKNEMGFPQARIESLHDQLAVFSWAIDNGYANHWTCAKCETKVKTIHHVKPLKHKAPPINNPFNSDGGLYDYGQIDV